MPNFKKIAYTVVSFAIVFSLTACGAEPAGKPAGEEQSGAVQGTPAIGTDTPSHISKVFSDSFSVEAEIYAPASAKADVLFASYMPFDEQKLLSIFFSGKTPLRETYTDGAVQYSSGDTYLTIYNGSFTYRTADFAYYKAPTEDFYPLVKDTISAGKRFADVYQQESLPFMDKSEAQRTVSAILAQLNIRVADDAEVYAIDHQTMQAQQDARGAETDDIYKTKPAFTPDDDFYLFFFTVPQNGINITQHFYDTLAGERSLLGSTVRVAFAKNGTIAVECSGIYQQKGTAESISTLISADAAIQKAFEKHDSVLSSEKILVTAIDFEYVPVAYNDNREEVKLTPAWSLTYTSTTENEKSSKDGKPTSETNTRTRVIFINAVTGAEIK